MSVGVSNQTHLKVENTPVLLAHVLSTPQLIQRSKPKRRRNTGKTTQELPAEPGLARDKLEKQALLIFEDPHQDLYWQS